LIIDPQGLPADIAKLLANVRLASVPSVQGSDSAPKTTEADAIEFSSILKHDPKLQQTQSILANIATAVSCNQVFDGVLQRLQITLERLLAIAELSQNPNLSEEQRAAYAAELVVLQRSLAGGEPKAKEPATVALGQQFHALYGVPVEGGWKQLLEKLTSDEERRRLRRNSRRGRIRFPRCSLIVMCFGRRQDFESTMESILEQKYPDFECLVIHPGRSTIGNAVTDNINKDAILVEAPNISRGILAAHQACSGDVIGWLDAGELLCPHSLQTAGSVFLKNADVEWLGGIVNAHVNNEIARSSSNFGGTDALMAPKLGGTFWRRSLWERIEPMARMAPEKVSETGLADLFLRSTPHYSANAILTSPESKEQESDSELPAISQAERLSGTVKSQLLQLGSHDIYPMDSGRSLDTLAVEIERAMRYEQWKEGADATGAAAAVDPSNPDLFGLEAICEYQLGRVAQAHGLLQNVELRFRSAGAVR
jgi:hypothetical protein